MNSPQRFESAQPKEILAWCLKNIPIGLVQTTAFSVTGRVIGDILYRILAPQLPVPVLFIDALYHSQSLRSF
jgi:phosphoadenosine phosphosulfate reductase